MRKSVAATVVAIDEAVATVIDALKDVGMLENTLLIFSTDNGGKFRGKREHQPSMSKRTQR